METFDADYPPSLAVIEAVAEQEGVDPTELSRSLDEVIDVDALDSLFTHRSSGEPRDGGQLSFSYYGYHVTVHSSGVVLLDAERLPIEA